jgi:hypothetical protein
MPLYQYVKAPPTVYRPRRKRPVGASFLLMGLGGGILLWVLWPILSFAALSDSVFSSIITPISDSQKIINGSPLSSVAYAASSAETLVNPASADFTNANMWYPTAPQKHYVPQVGTYSLSIPKLKINNALVTIAGESLDASLIHYGGTGLPGEYGNAVVFGHSTSSVLFADELQVHFFSPSYHEGRR